MNIKAIYSEKKKSLGIAELVDICSEDNKSLLACEKFRDIFNDHAGDEVNILNPAWRNDVVSLFKDLGYSLTEDDVVLGAGTIV